MALTQEILLGNESLKSLKPEQLDLIVQMSKNDEESVIGSRIGKMYRDLDESIYKTSGIPRNGDEKTYLYMERALKSLKENWEKAENKIKNTPPKNIAHKTTAMFPKK